MKKFIILFLFLVSFLEAKNYHLIYKNIDAGLITDFNDLDKGYFTIVPTNLLSKAAISFNDKLIFHLKNNKPNIKNTIYKEDKYNLINILNFVKKTKINISQNLSKNKKLVIKCKEECTWELLYKDKLRTNGLISFLENGEIKEFIDLKNNIKIIYF